MEYYLASLSIIFLIKEGMPTITTAEVLVSTLLYNYLPDGPSVEWCHGRPAPGAAFCVSISPSWLSREPHPWLPSASLPPPVSSSVEQIKS